MPAVSVEYGVCPVCGYLMLPVLGLSPCGHEDTPDTAPMEALGTVYSHTRVEKAGGQSTVIAMADFFEGRLRVSAPITGSEFITIGDTVRVVAGANTPYTLRVTKQLE